MYFWEGELKLGVAPRFKVIKTAIYGVRPSGNIAECGIRKTAELTKVQYPEANDVLLNDLYVDDCMSGSNSDIGRSKITEELSGALGKGGFRLKGSANVSAMRNPKLHLRVTKIFHRYG